MPDPNPAALDFLLTRRSRPAKTLTAPAPDRAIIAQILQAGARTPDHGCLEPWRFIVLQGDAMHRVANQIESRAIALGKPQELIDKARNAFANVPASIAVVACPKPSEKIPEVEQILSAGAVCLSVLNAALASGWGANWITGWMASDRELLSTAFDLKNTEFVAGFIHLGTETIIPQERKRPDVDALTNWITT